MASLNKQNHDGRNGWRLRFYLDKKRKSLWLGAMSKRAAETFKRHIEELVCAGAANVSPDPETTKWTAGLDGHFRETLQNWGMVDAGAQRNSDGDRFLGAFCDRYIKGRTDVSQATRDNYGHARRLLVERFGESHLIGAITAGDAERWRRWLLARPVAWDDKGNPTKTMAIATVSKHVKRAKTMFDEAAKDRLLPESPFKDLKTGSEANRDRDHYIGRSVAQAVLSGCPDVQWRLIFALARFCGLRRCEILVLTWGDVQWDVGKLRIDSPKTGVRFCPIFPEALPLLREAFDAAPVGTTRIIHRYHRTANLGTQMNRIIEQSGVPIWEKTFQNLRATRRTELQEKFQDHVVNAWMGHSSATAAKHYLQVTDEHFAAGLDTETGESIRTTERRGPTGGPSDAAQPIPEQSSKTKKPRKTLGFEGLRNIRTGGLATPLGLEPRMTGPKPVVLPITPRGSGGGESTSESPLWAEFSIQTLVSKEGSGRFSAAEGKISATTHVRWAGASILCLDLPGGEAHSYHHWVWDSIAA